MAWFQPAFGTGCGLHVPIVPNQPSDVRSDIYALDYWMYHHIYHAGLHRNLSSATHVFIPSQMKKKAQLIRLYKDKTFIVNDFGPVCRFQHLGHHKNVRFLMMSPGDGACRRSEVDIISPHTVVSNDPTFAPRRIYRIFFYGHLPKPYIRPPISQLRSRIYRDLHDAPNSIVGAYDVEENVNALTTNDTRKLCQSCSYQCKTCYFATELPVYGNAMRIGATRFRSLMQASVFCIVARGDNPGCPKLAESITSGCIPVIVMDQMLPFEKELNYSTFSIIFDPIEVMKKPAIIRQTLSQISQDKVLHMQRTLKLVSDMFAVRSGGTPFNMQTKLLHDMCE